MRRRRLQDQDETELNLTPMLDVVFIMLIFFIVTASFVKEAGIDVSRPDAATAERKERGNILVAKGLSRRGVPANLIMAALLVSILGYYIAYLIMVLITLSILQAHYQVHPALFSAFALLAVLAIGIPAVIVWL